MRTIIISILFLGTLVSGCTIGKKEKINDLEKLSLHGKVRSIHERKHIARDPFGVIDTLEIRYMYDYVTFFDEAGFDLEGDKTKTSDSLAVKVYDKRGRLVRKEETDGAVKRIFTYDKHGNIIRKDYFDMKGRLLSIYFYKYDKRGNMTEELCMADSVTFEYRISSHYDHKGNLTKKKWDNHNDYYDATELLKYDKESNLTEHTIYNPSENTYRTSRFEYIFDSCYNWITMKETDYGGQVFITDREIVYY